MTTKMVQTPTMAMLSSSRYERACAERVLSESLCWVRVVMTNDRSFIVPSLPFLKVAFRLRVFLMLELLVLVGSLWRPNSGLDSIPGTQACSAQCKSQPRSPCQGWISHVCLRGSIHTSVWSLCSQGSVQGFSAVRAQDSTPQLPVFSSIGGSGLPTSSPCQRRRTPHQMARIVDSQKSSSPFRLYIHIYIHILIYTYV